MRKDKRNTSHMWRVLCVLTGKRGTAPSLGESNLCKLHHQDDTYRHLVTISHTGPLSNSHACINFQ